MVFSSVIFLFCFFPLTFLGYYLIRKEFRNAWLLIASIIFYAWGEPRYIFLILVSTSVNYYLGLVTDNQEDGIRRKVAVAVSVIWNIGILVYFKYSTWFADIILSTMNIDLNGTFLVSKTAMPIGISFFTFQILSYQIDVYRRHVPAQKSISKLTLYILLFPQMIAGPIVRYIDVANEIDNRDISTNDVYEGIVRFMVGFSKKILLSNSMALIADYAYSNIGISAALSWLGAICYSLQIYFDFSGYSDMAIGMGRMAGFHFLENFDRPYISRSIREFWRRWHISLSSWFRDYLYISLGGNRKGMVRTYINLLIIFFTTGLWHGASFNFIVWGLFHGFFMCVERLGFGNTLKKVPKPIGHVYTLLVVLIGWVFFRADTLSDALQVIATMFTFTNWNAAALLSIMTKEKIFFLIVGLIILVLPYNKIRSRFNGPVYQAIYAAAEFVFFIIAVLYTIGTDFNPFIYFRF